MHLKYVSRMTVWGNSLLRIRNLVLNRAIIIRTAAVRASTLFAVRFDIVVAELANLQIKGQGKYVGRDGDKGRRLRMALRGGVPDIHKDMA